MTAMATVSALVIVRKVNNGDDVVIFPRIRDRSSDKIRLYLDWSSRMLYNMLQNVIFSLTNCSWLRCDLEQNFQISNEDNV